MIVEPRTEISKIATALLFMLVPFSLSANVVGPSLYIVELYCTWYIFLIGFVIEFFVVRSLTKAGWLKTLLMTMLMNLLTAFLGLLIIPFSGILLELVTMPFRSVAFACTQEVLDCLLAVIGSTLIDVMCLQWIFGYRIKQIWLWLIAANSISIIISAIIPLMIKH